MRKYIFPLMAVFLLVLSCEKDKIDDTVVPPVPVPTVEIHLVPKLDGQTYQLDQVIESPLGYRYFFSDIKWIGTDVVNGSNVLTSAFYFNYREKGTLLTSANGNMANFTNISMNFGVPNPLNHADPTLPSNESPLNISNAGDMHWGWNPGYIFVKLEGKVDTIADGIDNFDHNFVFHLGMDEAFRTKTFTNLNWANVSDTKSKTSLLLQIRSLFDQPGNEMDLRTNYITHSATSQMVLTNLVMDQFKNAIEKE